MKLIKTIFITLLVILTNTANADCTPDWCASVTLEIVYVNASGYIYVATSGTETNLNCTAVSDQYLTLDPAVANAEEVYSAILTAKASDAIVSIQVEDFSSHCFIQYIRLE